MKIKSYFTALLIGLSMADVVYADIDMANSPMVASKEKTSIAKKFTLTAIYFNKVDLIDSVDFFPLYEYYLGASITVSRIRKICSDITNFYHNKGFITANCTVPPQTISKGVVSLHITEGIIASVSLTGDVDSNDTLLKAYISTITLGQSLDVNQLNKVERKINALAGVSVQAYTQAIENSDKLSLIFEIKQVDYSSEFYANNRGSKVIGPIQIGASVSSNSLFGLHEYLRFNVQTTNDTKELKYVALNTSWPIGKNGATLLLESSYANSKPGDFLTPLNIDVDISTSRAGWSRPFVQDKQTSFLFTGWLDYFKSDTAFSNNRVALDKIYKIKIEIDYIFNQPLHYFKTNIALSHGLPGLNSTLVNSSTLVSTGREDFETMKFDIYYRYVLQQNLLLSLQTQGQYSFTDLPISEQILFGGEVMGSAYDPAEFFGDHGLGGKSRLSYQLSSSLTKSSYTQIYTQYDIVKVWNNDLKTVRSGASLGFGMSLGSSAFSVDLQVAKPLTKEVLLEGNKNARFFGNMRMFF